MRDVNRIPWWVWPITAALLIIATFNLPYGYYTILRIVVCGFAVVVFFHTWENDTPTRKWPLTFAGMAILFNPLVPAHLDRATWFYLDMGAAIVIVAHLIAVRVKSKGPT
jgi:chromate transport protein ChrA